MNIIRSDLTAELTTPVTASPQATSKGRVDIGTTPTNSPASFLNTSEPPVRCAFMLCTLLKKVVSV